jgi:hypothetical protein
MAILTTHTHSPRCPNYRKERCAAKGAYPPFPFMNGALELLSAPLVRYVGTSPEVSSKQQAASGKWYPNPNPNQVASSK